MGKGKDKARRKARRGLRKRQKPQPAPTPPPEPREPFKAPEGSTMIEADYAGAELNARA